ncbi:hypothetical protein CBF85_07575 [Lactobacillus taiwanensis]|uniref:Uncharacterized protein n=1 Tax=Lactobacillus taiwanensis TaxID=508451 RepID=A0A256LIJ6_9LACO|nr:hypothetical protein CBF53_00780 [Lactobacillus taiwanensis]OYR90230.1 hypothetical protein CBF59_09230 [Lactobacillus taiwanensis]OYR93268.1 hypothetical protein CBF70_01365 [Lactobacillus taiwanensis]OYR94582.1 hypothetical protein CBF51_10425 [Lactobacillus taiwanensis]OYR97226.1 hypothetical protein CBF58_00610 [Lactobacillus taiwanensis]
MEFNRISITKNEQRNNFPVRFLFCVKTFLSQIKKAQLLIINKVVSLKQAAQDSGIPYHTLRNFVNKPENMKNAAWIRIHRLANVYDQIIKSL